MFSRHGTALTAALSLRPWLMIRMPNHSTENSRICFCEGSPASAVKNDRSAFRLIYDLFHSDLVQWQALIDSIRLLIVGFLMKHQRNFILILLSVLLLVNLASASAEAAEKRIALVVGN